MSFDRMSEMTNAIKNAAMTKKREIDVFYSKECEAVAKVLERRGFLEHVKVFKEKEGFKRLGILLAFDHDLPLVTDVKRVSKPGRRVYRSYDELHRVAAGTGVIVISTSRGIMNGEEAKKKKLGGEVICEVR
jgi:small subunit ribosomal protein S8